MTRIGESIVRDEILVPFFFPPVSSSSESNDIGESNLAHGCASARYADINTINSSFRGSDGWKYTPQQPNQSRGPVILAGLVPKSKVNAVNINPLVNQRYLYLRKK
jgi:hypothetical protein